MVGKGVLLECLDSDDVEKVLTINRSSHGIIHPKLKEILHDDFYDFSSLKQELKGYNTVYFTLGVSAAGMSEEKYRKITYDLTMNFARLFHELNPKATFIYVSGEGTDSSEKGRMMWARVKGKTENDLLKLFKNAYMFRPGYIQPMRGIKSKTKLYNSLYVITTPFYPLLKKAFPNSITDSVKVGRAMLELSKNGSEQKMFSNSSINKLSEKYK